MLFFSGVGGSFLYLAPLALLLASFAPAHAQVPPDGATAARAVLAACPPPAPMMTPELIAQGLKTAPDRGPLWRIEKDGRSSWLYGTAHIARLQWVFPGPGIIGALRQSDTLALELNPLDTESLKPLTEAPSADMLARVMDAPRAARMARHLELACLPAGSLDALRPALRVATLLALNARNDGLYLDFGIDSMLAGMALGLKKPIVALETAQDQLLLIAGSTPDDERRRVDSALDELESGKSRPKMVEMIRAWAAADLNKLNAYPQWCECMDKPEDRAFMKRLLDDRNVLMAQKIDRLHEGGQRVFAAVGILHMIGEQSLPTLMRAHGYRVEAVAHAPDRQEPQPQP